MMGTRLIARRSREQRVKGLLAEKARLVTPVGQLAMGGRE